MLQLHDKTLGQWLEYWAETTPDKEYIVYSDRDLRFTWSEFNQRVDKMAKGLLAIGVRKDTHVGIWAQNVPDWLTFLYACAKIGAVAVTVNTNYKEHDLAFVVKHSDMHTLCITDGAAGGNYLDIINKLIPELRTQQRGYLKSERFPELKNLVYIGQEKYRGMYNTAEILVLGNSKTDDELLHAKSMVGCHDVVNMQYTSGTTGFPKGVMLSHHNIANNGFLTGEHMRFTPDDKLCICVPLFHCFGITLAVMNCLTHGSTQVMVEKFDPLLVLASIHKERCTALYGVPTMFIAELNHPMFEMFDMSSLRTGIMAGALCPIELMRRVNEKMFMKITSVYGLTESSPGMTQSRIDDPEMVRYTSVGREYEFTEVSIIDPVTGEECPVGVEGEKDIHMKIIKTENLIFDYVSRDENEEILSLNRALDDLSIEVQKGDFVAILGHNGSGKSTLAKQLNAILLPTKGTVLIKGMDTQDDENLWDIRQSAGMVFQNPDNQIIGTVVEEDVGFGPENLGVATEEIWERVEKSLKAVNMLDFRTNSPNKLSGGQKQRVAIAGIMAMEPECIILDEPTAMLDPIGRKEVLQTAHELNKNEGVTVLLITHYMNEVVDADKVIVMDQGKIVMQGSPKEIFSRVDELKKYRLDVPQVTQLAYELKKEGIDMPDGVLTTDEFVDAVCDNMKG